MKMSKVEQLLSSAAPKAERVKASFNLTKTTFDGFRMLCEERHLNQGDLVDAMLEDLLARFAIVNSKTDASVNASKRRGRPRADLS